MENIQAKLVTIKELFEDKFFKIPDYQRGYSWDKDQLLDLKSDIEHVANLDHKHYTGTIVASANGNNVFELVDGQQRITTLYILMHEIYLSDPEKYKDILTQFIRRGDIGNFQYILTPNLESENFFKECIIENKNPNPEIKSHESIQDAKTFFRKWIFELKNENSLDLIYNCIINKLGFLFFVPPSDKEIGIMFEVINNRGKSLSELEKIKNFFIYFSTVKDFGELRKIINEKWKKLQVNLSKAFQTRLEEENSFLKYCYIVFYESSKERSGRVYDELKLKYNPKGMSNENAIQAFEEIKKFVNFMESASYNLAYFYNRDYLKSEFMKSNASALYSRLDKVLTYLRCQPTIASSLPLYLSLMHFKEDKLEEVVNLLEVLEKVNFRIYVLPKIINRSDSKQSDMYYFANFFYHHYNENFDVNKKETYSIKEGKEIVVKNIDGDIFHWLKCRLIEIGRRECTELKFIQAVTLDYDEADDFYWWNGLRFFLASYEEYLQQKSKITFDVEQILNTRKSVGSNLNDYLSVEHIWAKENRSYDFPPDTVEKRRLGNLVLLGISSNISLSDNDIEAKVKELNENNDNYKASLFQIKEVKSCYQKAILTADIKSYSRQTKNYFRDLSAKISDLRETEMIRFALERWRLPEETFTLFKKVNSFKNPDPNLMYVLSSTPDEED